MLITFFQGPSLGKGGLPFVDDEEPSIAALSADVELDVPILSLNEDDVVDSTIPSIATTPPPEGPSILAEEAAQPAVEEEDLPFEMPSPSLYPTSPKKASTWTGTPPPKAPPKVKKPYKQKQKPFKAPEPTAANVRVQNVHNLHEEGLLPRETGEDIGMASPVPLTPEVVEIIAKLRDRKDEKEEYARWRDTVFLSHGAAQVGFHSARLASSVDHV